MSAMKTMCDLVISDITEGDDHQEANPALWALLFEILAEYVLPRLMERCNMDASEIHRTAAKIESPSTLGQRIRGAIQERTLNLMIRRPAGPQWRDLKRERCAKSLIKHASDKPELVQQCCIETMGTDRALGEATFTPRVVAT